MEASIRVYSQPNRYYAGYMMYGYETYAPWGVYARIYTINPTVSSGNVFFEWDTVMLSYRDYYWLQLGYNINPQRFSGIRFYYERVDGTGHPIHYDYPTGPSTSVTYSYMIVYVQGGVWRFCIRDLNGNTLYTTDVSANPYAPRDLQAFAETSDQHIRLDGTHFTYISYYDGRSWPLWNRHVPRQDWPYTLTQVSHYEFYASGGL